MSRDGDDGHLNLSTPWRDPESQESIFPWSEERRKEVGRERGKEIGKEKGKKEEERGR